MDAVMTILSNLSWRHFPEFPKKPDFPNVKGYEKNGKNSNQRGVQK